MTQSRFRDEGTGEKFTPSISQSLLGSECVCPPTSNPPIVLLILITQVMVAGGGALGDDSVMRAESS